MDDWEQSEQHQETWDSFLSYQVLAIQNDAHLVTTEVPPRYDGTTSWFKYSDAVEEWCDLTKVKALQVLPDAPLQPWPDRLSVLDGEI